MKRDRIVSPSIGELITHSFSTLLEEIANGQSARMQEYLAFSARFHKYSPENKLLIYEQCPHATRVAGYNKWKQEGYQVAKGEHAIRIKAPIVKKDTDGDGESHIVGFLEVSVFDVSQLTPDKRPPAFFPEVPGDFEKLYSAMHTAVAEGGIHVLATTHTQGAQGYTVEDTIVVKEGLTSGNRCLALLHGWANHVLQNAQVRKKLTGQVKQCHAEATSYIVATYYGIPALYSADYLLHWGSTPETLKQEMDSVQSTASHIITRIEAVLKRTDNTTIGEPNNE